MSYETYRLLHIGSFLLLFLSLGGILLTPVGPDRKLPRGPLALHGIALLALLVAGFGLLARKGITWPWPEWIWGKAVVWLVLGAMPSLLKAGIVTRAFGWIVAVALGVCAAWLVIHQPTW